MRKEREQEIRSIVSELENLPDGAFMAVIQERGVTIDELAEVYGGDSQGAPA